MCRWNVFLRVKRSLERSASFVRNEQASTPPHFTTVKNIAPQSNHETHPDCFFAPARPPVPEGCFCWRIGLPRCRFTPPHHTTHRARWNFPRTSDRTSHPKQGLSPYTFFIGSTLNIILKEK